MTLTIETVKEAKQKAKSTGKPVKLGVGKGVRLNVSKSSAVFQLRYKIKEAGKAKERTLTLDPLRARTNITLSEAITKAVEQAEDAKALLKQGLDPSKEKRINKIQTTTNQSLDFSTFFHKWVNNISKNAQWSEKHHKDMAAKFKLHIAPLIGSLPLNRISRQHISNLLEQVSDKPATYKKVRSLLNMVFEDAITAYKIEHNPVPRKSASAVTKYKAKQLPAVTSLPLLQNILAGINKVNLMPEVRIATLLQAHTALRSQSVIAAQWDEIDLTNKLWKIPRIKGRMKLSDAKKYGDYFVVPLSDEVCSIISQWRDTLRWQNSVYLFPSSSKSGHITIEAISKVYKVRLKLDNHCAHGWRSSLSTLAHEAIETDGRAMFRADVIERCLDHVVGNEVTQAYNRGELLELRRSLMQWWSKQLSNTSVVELKNTKTS